MNAFHNICRVWFTVSIILVLCAPLLRTQDENVSNVPNTISNIIPDEETTLLKSRAVELGDVLRKRLMWLRRPNGKDNRLDLVFLVDASSSVGPENFESELRFVRKLLADLEVSDETTRVALVTFASSAVRHVDTVSDGSAVPRHKCDILERALPAVNYSGGATYTLGAMLEAQNILRNARSGSKRAVFLLTDGYSNGGDPLPAARTLREELGATVFTFGVRSGNTRELADMASKPEQEHTFFLPSFEQFAALARRALHQDLRSGARFEVQDRSACEAVLCTAGSEECGCADGANCLCDTLTGRSQCVCPAGYQGSGLRGECHQCPSGTFASTHRIASSNNSMSELQYSTRCVPCPDPGHESPPGATSVSECRCREGFTVSAIDPRHCQVLECPPLQPPPRGLFVGGPCANVFNAACGMTCATGHRLIGSSIRLCRANGTWSGQQPRCARRECPPLHAPANGWLKCKNKEENKKQRSMTEVDATCELGCEPGFALLGSHTRKCLALGAWNGLPSTCKEVKCAPVPVHRRVRVSPESCSSRTKQPAGHECRFKCRDLGFDLRGSKVRRCGTNGRWSGSKPRCVDIQPPELSCPPNVILNTLPGEDVAQLNVSWPNVEDNSGGHSRLRISPPVMLTGGRLKIGKHRINLKAIDPSGNFATCRFAVTVKDRQAPDVHECESPPSFLTATDEAHNVTWSEPTFTDNSGLAPRITSSHKQGTSFKRGVTEVRYEARDEAGNVAVCVLNITVEDLQCETPLQGHCMEDERGACLLICDEGYAFALAPDPDLTCDPTQHDSPFPDCSVISLPDTFSQNVEVEFPTNSSTVYEEECNLLTNSVEEEITQAVSESCLDEQCHLQRVSDSCLSQGLDGDDKQDGENNVIVTRRRRRVVRGRLHPAYKIGSQNSSHSVTFRLVGQLRASKLGSKGVRTRLGMVKALISGITAGGIAKNFSQKLHALRIQLGPLELGCPAGSVFRNNTYTDICVQCPRGTFHVPGARECSLCSAGFFQPKPGQAICQRCPTGTSTKPGGLNTKRQHCRPLCGPGTKSRDGVKPCTLCPHGTFQSLSGQHSCTQCPDDTTTQRRGSNSSALCKELCAPDTVSRSGLAPCLSCPEGYIQDRKGQKVCEPEPSVCSITGTCPAPLHASHPCLQLPCQQGSTCLPFPNQHRHFRCHCPLGRIGTFCEEEVPDVCASSPCDNGGICFPNHDNTTLTSCDPDVCDAETNITSLCTDDSSCNVEVLTSSEENNQTTSTCSTSCPKANFTCACPQGFNGSLCEEDIDECADTPCGDHGLCTDLPGDYSCDCARGYGGRNCELIESACLALEPCAVGNCTDTYLDANALVPWFKCECPASRSGIRCEDIKNPCDSKGCIHGATCVPEPWPEQEDVTLLPNATCLCPSGYYGTHCEIPEVGLQYACNSNPCMNGGTCRVAVSEFLLGDFTCTCTEGFAGETCNIPLPKDAVLRFPGRGSLGYVLRENALSRPLHELTLCSWLRTADTVNYGTPVSYATPNQDNTLALTDYSGFVVYVNGERAVTDVAVNDGAWHLVCLLWASQPRGAWRLYKDGILSDEGDGLANNTLIPGGGTLVLGQEQDSPGGSFSSAQSFLGRLGPTALWPTLLSPTRLRAMFEHCGDGEADVDSGLAADLEASVPIDADAVALWSWKDALSGIRGKLQLESSKFCAGCAPPPTLQHGLVNVSGVGADAVATFSCLPGFRLIGTQSAECGKRGTWQPDSPQPSSCQRISCGRPTVPANAKLEESSGFEFESRLHIKCLPGFMGSASFIECLASGKWSEISGSLCVEAGCTFSSLTKVTNGSWHYLRGSGEEATDNKNNKVLEVHVGEQVELVCDAGFSARGPALLTCLDDGQWDADDETSCMHPACMISPPRVANARAPLVSGGKARYSCLPGHVVHGNPLVTCVDGWRSLPSCVAPSRCLPPPDVENATVTYDKTLGIARYVCIEGFVMDGEAEVNCSKTGAWSTSPPVCQPQPIVLATTCVNIPHVEHGIFTAVGNTASVECDKGYYLFGSSQFRCEGDTWEGDAKCHTVGCELPSIEHGTYTVTKGGGEDGLPQLPKGTIVEFKCNSGHQLVGPRSRKCLSYEKQWSSVQPYCKPEAS